MDTKRIVVTPRTTGTTATRCTDTDVQVMTAAISRQVAEHVAPAFGRVPTPIEYLPRTEPLPATTDACVIFVQNTPPRTNVAGYHDQDMTGGKEHMFGYVAVDKILAAGKGVRAGALSVAHTLSHEVIETFIDPSVNLWAALPGTAGFVMLEIGDPVQVSCYDIDGVTVSNFVYYDWFNPMSAGPRFDHLGHLTGPMKIEANGYATLCYANGKPFNSYGSAFPDWLREMKESDLSRSGRGRRIAAPVGAKNWRLEEQPERRGRRN